MSIRAGKWAGCLMIAGAILMWPPMVLFAQTGTETPVEEPASQAASEEAESELQKTGQEATEQADPIPIEEGKPPSRFIPSEEISEDKSVPFPVDI